LVFPPSLLKQAQVPGGYCRNSTKPMTGTVPSIHELSDSFVNLLPGEAESSKHRTWAYPISLNFIPSPG
jgi:hypothetical protein